MNKRQLRNTNQYVKEKEEIHEVVNDEDKFDFDNYLVQKLPKKLPIAVSATSTINTNLYCIRNRSIVINKKTLKAPLLYHYVTKKRIKSIKHKKDTLNDELYLKYHTKMEKEEKKMANIDKNLLFFQFDNYSEQLNTLNMLQENINTARKRKDEKLLVNGKGKHSHKKSFHGNQYVKAEEPLKVSKSKKQKTMCTNDNGNLMIINSLSNPFNDVFKKLTSITKINDLRNLEEINLKYKLTIFELEEFMEKFENLKKKESSLRNNEQNDESSDEEEDLTMKVADLKRKRLRKRCSKLGPIIKIKLNNSVIVIDPILPPKIIKLSDV
ncbi:hypothetical protein PACTADRAFT_185793 [Pachysolen tannophilus NRRL Y-2460]|uniref:Something about silencing protein 4 domain-containing protein n=1 Tax=Pachysolen tannophilus NRRL Y-2460 TaxID=669874 RepID=A0A1E4U1M9_PACTA|nr:hypothetical protein PACTADRAFT_185793 [Pachysolen tannophilus NRRL Y-2460]